MRWRRETDYHNSRSYGDEAQRQLVPGSLLTIVWLLDATRRVLDSFLTPKRSEPTETSVLEQGDSRGFAALGSLVGVHAPHESAITCPFPELDDRAALRRQWERLGRAASLRRAFPGNVANDWSAQANEQ